MSVAIDLTKTVKEIITTMKTVIDDIQDNYQTKTDIADTYESQTDASTAHTALQNSIAAKQDKLTFDDTPTVDSLNPVTSDGIRTYVDNINSTLNTAISKKADSTDIVQSDWNITDMSDKGYIKNKPDTWLTTNLSRPNATNGVKDYTMRSMIDIARANRLVFLPADQIIIEQTVDGGITWTDAGFDDKRKAGLFDGTTDFALGIPKIDGKENALCGLRVTITAMEYNVPDGTAETDKYNYWNKTYVKRAERYCSLDSFYIWCSSASNRIKIKIEMATGNKASNWVTCFSDDTFGMTGEAGGNCINITNNNGWYTFGGDTTQYDNFWNYRLTFMTASNRLNDNITIRPEITQSIISICGYGENIWTKPNRLAYNGHLYTWDSSQNATFPANITANIFKGSLNGNAATATKATQDSNGNDISTTYATKTEIAAIDLSNYYTKSQVDSAISTAISAIIDGDSKSY